MCLMHSRRRKNLLWIWLVTALLISVAVMSKQISASPTTTLFAPVILDATKTPGTTFSADISIADVEKMWGYQFYLFYNTTILTVTGASSQAPFTEPQYPGEGGVGYFINDTRGYIIISYSMPYGETVGFATVDAKPIAKIDFTVDAIGKSELHFANGTEPGTERPIIATVTAGYINADVHDGFFANVAVEVHDVAVTSVTAPTTLALNESGTITVTVENKGNFTETFNVTIYYDIFQIGTPQTVTDLAAGSSRTLTFTWDTVGVLAGEHTIKAVASTVPGEYITVNNSFSGIKVTIGGGGGGDFYLYAGIAIVVIVIVAILLVYLRRSRKPKAA